MKELKDVYVIAKSLENSYEGTLDFVRIVGIALTKEDKDKILIETLNSLIDDEEINNDKDNPFVVNFDDLGDYYSFESLDEYGDNTLFYKVDVKTLPLNQYGEYFMDFSY